MSIAELVVILIVALFAFGPKQLPTAARNLGRLVGYVQNTWQRLKSEFDAAQQQTLSDNIAKAQAAETSTATQTQQQHDS